MAEKLEEELDQLTDEEIEARLAAAVWVDDKRAAVLRYLEEKKLGKKKEARSAEFAIARNAKEAAWAAASLAKEANWRANLAITIASVAAAAASQQQSSPWSACILSGEVLPCWRARRCLIRLQPSSACHSAVNRKHLCGSPTSRRTLH